MLKSKFKNHFKTLSFLFFGLCVPIVLSSCSSSSNFYLANFESYMAPKLMESIKEKYNNVQYKYYGTNENLERSFDRNYDVAIPSTYLVAKMIEEGKLEKINWQSFNLQYIAEDGTKRLVTCGEDAKNLFVPDVAKIVSDIYEINGEKVNLLDYGVPYFLQDLIFGYKGNVINELNKPFSDSSSIMKSSWTDIIEHLKDKVGFKKEYNKIVMIDDYRTIYSIPRLMETNNFIEPTVNPNIELNKPNTIEQYRTTYEYLSKNFNTKNTFLLNSDSGTVLNDFANPKGSDLGIMYNGDLLYSLLGGDEFSNSNTPPFLNSQDKVNYVRPNKTLMALDMLVINKNTKHLKEAHNIIKKIALEGLDEKGGVMATDKDDYKYGPMINFDYVTYTSPLKDIYNYVTRKEDGYFSYLEDKGYKPFFIDKLINIFKVESKPSPTNMIEKGLSELDKSNMYYGYMQVRAKL